MVITEGYRRMPKDTEIYRKLPKAGLKIEYRPNVSGVVANLELGNAWGQAPSRFRAGRVVPLKLAKSLFCFWISQAKFH